MKKSTDRKDMEKLIKYIKQYINSVDEEMEHGNYQAPDEPPYKFENERNYHSKHSKIITKVVHCRVKLEDFIDKIESRNNNN